MGGGNYHFSNRSMTIADPGGRVPLGQHHKSRPRARTFF